MTLTFRQAVQRVLAKEFSSPEELQDYLRLHPKADKRKHSVRTKKPRDDVATELSSAPELATPSEVETACKAHTAKFEELHKTLKERVKNFKPTKEISRKVFATLGPAEQLLVVAGRDIGDHFINHVCSDPTRYETLMKEWGESSKAPESQLLHGYLSSIGVHGSMTSREMQNEEVSKRRQLGAKDKKYAATVKEVATYTQAFFKHIGVESLTLYRGTSLKNEVSKGAEANLGAREASSFSLSPSVADNFGTHTFKLTVPIDRVLMSMLTFPKDELEVVVTGAMDLMATCTRADEYDD